MRSYVQAVRGRTLKTCYPPLPQRTLTLLHLLSRVNVEMVQGQATWVPDH